MFGRATIRLGIGPHSSNLVLRWLMTPVGVLVLVIRKINVFSCLLV